MARARVTYGDLTADVTTAQRLFRETLPYVAAMEAEQAEDE